MNDEVSKATETLLERRRALRDAQAQHTAAADALGAAHRQVQAAGTAVYDAEQALLKAIDREVNPPTEPDPTDIPF